MKPPNSSPNEIWAIKTSRLFHRFTLLIAFVTLTVTDISSQVPVENKLNPVLTKPERTGSIDSGTAVIKPVTQQKPVKKTTAVTIAKEDSATEAAFSRAMVAYYYALERKNLSDAAKIDSLKSYDNWALTNRKNVIETQQVYAKIIFILVIVIVFSGLLFSALQFYIAIKHSKKKGPVSDTTLKASLGGIEVSSSILGVIILTLSIVFFYLYLTMVYPIVLVN